MEPRCNLESSKAKIRPTLVVAPTSTVAVPEQEKSLQPDQLETTPNIKGTLDQQVSGDEGVTSHSINDVNKLEPLELELTAHAFWQLLQSSLNQLAGRSSFTDQAVINTTDPLTLFAQAENDLRRISKETGATFPNEQLTTCFKNMETQSELVRPNSLSTSQNPPPPPPPPPPPQNLIKPTISRSKSSNTPNKIRQTDSIIGELKRFQERGSLRKPKEKNLSDKDLQSCETNFKHILKFSKKRDLSDAQKVIATESNQIDTKDVSPIIEKIRKDNLTRRQSIRKQNPDPLNQQNIEEDAQSTTLNQQKAKLNRHKIKSDKHERKHEFPFAVNLRPITNKPLWCVANETLTNIRAFSTSENQTMTIEGTPGKLESNAKFKPFVTELRSVKKPVLSPPNVFNENKENTEAEWKNPKIFKKPVTIKTSETVERRKAISSKTDALEPEPDRSLKLQLNSMKIENVKVADISVLVSQPVLQNGQKSKTSTNEVSDGDLTRDSQSAKKDTTAKVLPNVFLSEIQDFKKEDLKKTPKVVKKSSIDESLTLALKERARAFRGKKTDDSDSDNEGSDQDDVIDEKEWE